MRDLYLSYLLKKSIEGDPLVGLKKGLQYSSLILSRATRKSLAGPFHGAIVVTYKCNLRCPMCFLWKGPGEYDKQHNKKELSTEEMQHLIDDFAAIGTAGIGFTGGEPILRPDMLEIIKYTKKKDMVNILKRKGVDHVSFMPFHDIGLFSSGTENSEEFKIKQEKVERLNKAVDELINIKKKSKAIENSLAYLKLFKDAFEHKKLPFSCYAGYATVCIGAYGDIYPCFPRMEGEIGKGPNIRQTPLKEYWHSNQIREDREKVRACRECFWNNQTEINLLFHPFYKK